MDTRCEGPTSPARLQNNMSLCEENARSGSLKFQRLLNRVNDLQIKFLAKFRLSSQDPISGLDDH